MEIFRSVDRVFGESDEQSVDPERKAPFGEGLSARRKRQDDVDMMWNFRPSLRASARASGMLGVSKYPNVTTTLQDRSLWAKLRQSR